MNVYLKFLFLFISVAGFAQNLQDWGQYESVKNEAIARIENHRKGDATVQISLPSAQAAANATVTIKLKRHEFKWGVVVTADNFEGNRQSPHLEVYQQNLLKYFNAAGFGLALKPKRRGTATETNAEAVVSWFKDNDFYVRGHTLAWEGYNFLRPEDQATYDDPTLTNTQKGELLLESAALHFTHALPKWDVDCWDVSNEPIANDIINNLVPDMDTHVHWFKLADQIRNEHGKGHVKLYQNDYQVISAITNWSKNYTKSGYSSVGRPALYIETLDRQIADGAPIEGIGFQSRIKGGLITPDVIYQRLQTFEKYNLPFQGTEFEIVDQADKYIYNDNERRLISEFMMVMYFSHPKMDGFWHWTFADKFDGAENILDYSLFNYDGTPNVNGQIWIDLMDGFFDTELTLTTDALGELDMRGYYGDYEISTVIDGVTYTGSFSVNTTDESPNKSVDLTAENLFTTNLIENPDFEDGYATDWTLGVFGSAAANYSDAGLDAANGSAAAKVQVTQADGFSRVVLRNIVSTFDLSGKTLHISCLAKGLNENLSFKMRMVPTINGDPSYIPSQEFELLNNEFSTYTFTYEVPENVESLQFQVICGNTAGTYIFDDFSVTDMTLGIDTLPQTADYKIKIYPNPAKERIYVETEKAIHLLEVFDISGKVLVSEKRSNLISIGSLENGVYILKIKLNDGNIVAKKVIKN